MRIITNGGRAKVLTDDGQDLLDILMKHKVYVTDIEINCTAQ